MVTTGSDAAGSSNALDRALSALRRYQAREALDEIEGTLDRLDAGSIPGPTSWRARRHPAPGVLATSPRARPLTFAEAPGAVRRIILLARQLLEEDSQPLPEPRDLPRRLERVALLRDELHVTANRVARFSYDEHPRLDSIHLTARAEGNPGLGRARLLHQLDLTAARLAEQLETLSADDWTRTGRIGDRVVALGNLIDDVVDTGTQDLLDLLYAAPLSAPPQVTQINDRRSRWMPPAAPGSSPVSAATTPRDATAS